MDEPHDTSFAVSIRSATVDEVGTVLELWRDSETHPSTTDDPASVRALLEVDPEALLVAEVDDGIVGTLIAAFDGWRGNMYRLAVLPEHRRRGVARALVEAGEARLRSAGARRITALVAHEQTGAPEFWGTVGYEPDPHTTRFVKTL